MLTLKNVFDDLAVGVLANLSLSEPASGSINNADYPKILSFVNRALTTIHKRFPLRSNELVLQQYADITKYYLRPDFAVTNTSSLEPIKYIVDTVADPFQNDLLKVEQVFDTLGVVCPINDSSQILPIYTPEADTLTMVPDVLALQTLTVKYRADHPKIKITAGFNPEAISISLPDSFLDALYFRIASYAYERTSGEGEVSASRSYLLQYELECKILETENVTVDDNTVYNTFEDRGWV